MTDLKFDKEITALLVIDPYNDFISEGGKIWGRLKGVAEANNCVPHMMQVLDAARKAGLRAFYAPHHRYRPGDYETWQYIAPIQKATWSTKAFTDGTWGGAPDGSGEVWEPRLYQFIRQKGPIVDRTFEIEFLDPGVQALDFTFG